ncbi:MAG: 16S rRNA (uracil(1498)-N(3))-methyltransferase [Bacteroidetes bacterium]|nr:MAG: 16S rRNA (uracil(1498)-N(3))-methyltransferase [Bacteroidota bacterium]
MNLFYAPDISQPYYQLSEEESKHLIRVFRYRVGDEVFFTDGNGTIYTCTIIDASPKHCKVEVLDKREGGDKRPFKLQMGVAPTKNISRFEWYLEKATEIGIDSIIPFVSFHSERKDIKTDRLNRVITAAVKQSLKSFHPCLHDLMKFREMIELPFDGQKFIAFIDAEVTLELSKAYLPGSNAFILIGPEGDFSLEEVKVAQQHGFVSVKLGPSRLRTETAAVAACHTINLLNY